MKKLLLLLLVITVCLRLAAQPQNLLSGKYPIEKLKTIIIPQAQWTPFPKISNREEWSKADEPMMKAFLQKATTYINYDWPSIPATKSLLIERTGDREEYQSVSFKKREVLGTLLLAEVYENKAASLIQSSTAFGIFAKNLFGEFRHIFPNQKLTQV
jgi:hypothetical protein